MHEHLPDVLAGKVSQGAADLIVGEPVVPDPEWSRGIFARRIGEQPPDRPCARGIQAGSQ